MSRLLRLAAVVAIISVIAASVVGVIDARRHREAECEWRRAVVELAEKQAFALISATTPREPPTPEQQARRDEIVTAYLGLLDDAYEPLLQGCT